MSARKPDTAAYKANVATLYKWDVACHKHPNSLWAGSQKPDSPYHIGTRKANPSTHPEWTWKRSILAPTWTTHLGVREVYKYLDEKLPGAKPAAGRPVEWEFDYEDIRIERAVSCISLSYEGKVAWVNGRWHTESVSKKIAMITALRDPELMAEITHIPYQLRRLYISRLTRVHGLSKAPGVPSRPRWRDPDEDEDPSLGYTEMGYHCLPRTTVFENTIPGFGQTPSVGKMDINMSKYDPPEPLLPNQAELDLSNPVYTSDSTPEEHVEPTELEPFPSDTHIEVPSPTETTVSRVLAMSEGVPPGLRPEHVDLSTKPALLSGRPLQLAVYEFDREVNSRFDTDGKPTVEVHRLWEVRDNGPESPWRPCTRPPSDSDNCNYRRKRVYPAPPRINVFSGDLLVGDFDNRVDCENFISWYLVQQAAQYRPGDPVPGITLMEVRCLGSYRPELVLPRTTFAPPGHYMPTGS
jgi:hypothetical protein